jgi:transposase-like protein
MSKRRTHSPEYKSRVTMEAISGRKTIQEIAADHAIHPIQVSQWKRELLEGASKVFTAASRARPRKRFRPRRLSCCSSIAALREGFAYAET